MNGIASLAPGQAPQQGPQQGPQQPPQQGPQGGPQGTPQGMTAQLKDIPLPQLQMFMMNPNPQSPPLWAVISAIAEKQKEAKAMQMAQGDQVMAMNAQMQQQPPVAAQVMQSAQQMQEPVYAMHGGEMHGYSGGGAVAFAEGGRTFGYAPDYELARKYGIDLSPYDSPSVREEKIKRARAMADFEEQRKSFGEIPTEASVARDALLKQAYEDRSRRQDIPQKGITAMRPPAAPRPPAQLRPAAGQPKPTVGQGIGALASAVEQTGTPPVDETAAATAALQDAIRKSAQTTAEEKEARAGIDKLLSASVSGFDEERKRRETLAQQRMQEAQARYGRPFYQDPTFLGEIIGGMRGAKTFYEGATGAASAAGRAQAGREAAMRAAEEKFDLSRKEMFELNRLRDQVAMDQAKLVEARASGDAAKINKAEIDVAQSRQKLAEYQVDIGMKREKLGYEGRQTAAQEETARAATKRAEAEMIVAKSRGAARGALTPKDIARFRAQAEKDVDVALQKDGRYAALKISNPNAAATQRATMIKERLQRVLSEEGVSEAPSLPYSGPIYNFKDIGKE